MMIFSSQSQFERPFFKGMWLAFSSFLILLAFFSGNAHVLAAPTNSGPRLAPVSSKMVPQDLSKIVEKNDALTNMKKGLLQILEKNGQNGRNNEEFVLKMKKFLLLVTENKLEYLSVLENRLNIIEKGLDRSKLLTAEEVAEIRSAINVDIAFYEDKKSKIAAVEKWEDAKALGNEIRTYSEQTLSRLRGLAGLKIVNDALLLADRSEKISERLEKNIDELLASRETSTVAASPSESVSNTKVFDFDVARSELQTSIDSAKANIQTAKEIYLQLIRTSNEQDNDAKAREALRTASEDLKNARKASLEITIELMKEKMK